MTYINVEDADTEAEFVANARAAWALENRTYVGSLIRTTAPGEAKQWFGIVQEVGSSVDNDIVVLKGAFWQEYCRAEADRRVETIFVYKKNVEILMEGLNV